MNMYNIDIQVKTHFIATHSDEAANEYAFAYTITITNHSDVTVQLLKRAWKITDADHKITRVAGDGVVGEQPHIAPGESYSYTSGTVLATPIGTMEGFYSMVSNAGDHFDVEIPSFRLAIPNIIH
ncbi:Co2+/Mg2+ efflux protein ApaG [Pseudidiomarina tainanensis]|uniref:Co2+/Mg2+ efflux protein ApaG n=1 Tax=Pseudidiomarina tainanensis TaxID=502365 RepID=A0ACD2HFN9_9GAMM|nr:Co2+/Mg2+ efflux protein ApaG [Pseudidiomarina tainanensis]